MKKWFSLGMAAVLTTSLLAGCGTGSDETSGDGKKVLKMGTSADYAPFEYIDTAVSDEIIGFDVDLAKAIAGELGYEVKIEDIDFNGLIPALESEKVDFVLAGMTPTEDRKKNVDFSDVYYTAKHMIVTKKGSDIKTLEDLKGKKIGVQVASIQEGKAEELAEELSLTVENRNRIPELVQEINSNRFDAIIIEDTVAKGYLENNEIEGFVLEEGEDGDAGSAISFPKGSELTEDFNRELNEMKENGELEELIVKWFGGEE
ncbi:transporter substrate-binding domain-containing protein [Metabacillus iocasae]|uniref:Polar amino acid transport system substrate-binding protein n=1 Tax=Priestia iocasae TaxID=2291674 RepID=A0ABS2QS68_9BACI|nr:transporter substrate-binding domain-containing protein [Metabacillus iocasae]MBM7701611.1 polar amino acid transport system substrate-binding protein [Metabacillus iocasae]